MPSRQHPGSEPEADVRADHRRNGRQPLPLPSSHAAIAAWAAQQRIEFLLTIWNATH
jgi:hypothetical protein